MTLLISCISLFAIYAILILYYWRTWEKIPDFQPLINIPITKVSVIIPARNEEKNIGRLLQALSEQTYSTKNLEVIVVDDHSTDNTISIVKKFPSVKLVQLQDDVINSYKKKAVETGIAHSTGELIVCTDADCLPGTDWILHITQVRAQKKAVFIAAPVVFDNNNSFLEIFQALDFLTLQGITAASVYNRSLSMSNGANMAYDKKVFFEVNGFADIDRVASGDDLLLMHKIRKKYPDQIAYLKSKESIVHTEPMKTWSDFFNQRIRWASKAKYYDDKLITLVLLLVYLFNLSFALLLAAMFIYTGFWKWLLLFWIAKTSIEFPFVYSVARFYDKRSLLKYFFFMQPFHIAYTIISGFLGLMGKYEWKGRKVK
jgi:biofilm PGA synthesis N-glycosyltransferase PgaC